MVKSCMHLFLDVACSPRGTLCFRRPTWCGVVSRQDAFMLFPSLNDLESQPIHGRVVIGSFVGYLAVQSCSRDIQLKSMVTTRPFARCRSPWCLVDMRLQTRQPGRLWVVRVVLFTVEALVCVRSSQIPLTGHIQIMRPCLASHSLEQLKCVGYMVVVQYRSCHKWWLQCIMHPKTLHFHIHRPWM